MPHVYKVMQISQGKWPLGNNKLYVKVIYLQTFARQDRKSHGSKTLVQDTPLKRYNLRSKTRDFVCDEGPGNCVKKPRLQVRFGLVREILS